MHDELEEEISEILRDAQWLEGVYKSTAAELRAVAQLQGSPGSVRAANGDEHPAAAAAERHATQPAYRTKAKRQQQQQARPRASSGDDTAPTTSAAASRRSYERALEQLRAKAAKEEKLRAQLQMEQEAVATFQPQTTAKAKALTRGLEDMMAWEENRRSKQAVRRKQQLEDEQRAQTATPHLNARSRELARQRPTLRPNSQEGGIIRSAASRSQSSSHNDHAGLHNRSASVPAGAWQRDRVSSTRSRSRSPSASRLTSKSPARSRSTERPVRHSASEQADEPATVAASRQYRRQSAAQLDRDILQFEEGLVLRQPETRTATRRIRLSELEGRDLQLYATSSKRSSTHSLQASDAFAPRTPAAKLASRTPRDTSSMYTSPPYEDGIAE